MEEKAANEKDRREKNKPGFEENRNARTQARAWICIENSVCAQKSHGNKKYIAIIGLSDED